MTPSDDLGSLWQSIPEDTRDMQAMLREVERRARSFDRTIRRRDWREFIAGFGIAIVFTWMAVYAQTGLRRAADLFLAAYGLWVVLYLWRNSRAGSAAPEGTLAEYRAAVLQRYNRQIHLLRTAKYWYVLPFWAGGMLSAWAAFAQTRSPAVLMANVTAFSVAAAVLWWVNAAKGVPYVENQRRAVMQFFGEE